MPHFRILVLTALTSVAAAQSSSSATPQPTNAPVLLPAEVSDCHTHAGDEVFCFDNGNEWAITSDDATQYDGEAALTACVPHGEGGDVIDCTAPNGDLVTLTLEGGNSEHTHDGSADHDNQDHSHDDESHSEEEHDHDHDHDHSSTSTLVADAAVTASSSAPATTATAEGSAVGALGVSFGVGALGLGAAVLAL